LMLGTPNFGSHEAVRWLTGRNPTQARLSLLDITQDAGQIVRLVRDFPGLLELLPYGEGDADFSDPALWKKIRDLCGGTWETAREQALRDAAGTWRLLRGAAADPRHTCYVAGCQRATVVDYRFADPLLPTPGGRKRLEFLATREGDGTVSWKSGRLPELQTWYVEDTAHDALCAQPRAFPAYLDLLMTGRTSRLPDVPPRRARAAAGEPELFVLPCVPPADGLPSQAETRDFGFGSALPSEAPRAEPGTQAIEVSVRHGDLGYARHPVLVGHYAGDTIVSAEAALDRHLDGALTRRLDLAIYPGPLGTYALFFNGRAEAKPGGAIVVGLGQVGELTPGLLESGACDALLDYALQAAQWPDDRFGPAGSPRRASVSCLLVGSGAGGMTVRESVESILRGAVAANKRLADNLMDDRATIDRIEFLELYEDVAIQACEALGAILKDGELAGAVRWPDRVVQPGQAGLRRVRFEEAADWWHRLEIIEDEGRSDVLRFVFSTDRARAEETLATGQLALADAFIRRASQSAAASPDAARTLFEMLLPLRLRESSPWQTSLVLLVDERSARYPWELLEDRWSPNGRPPTVNAGMVRQLKTATFRPRPAQAQQAKALVVGNPDLGGWDQFADLQGARREAQHVAGLLAASGFETRDSIDEDAAGIMSHLHRDAWRILHLAGHGAHEFPLSAAAAGDGPACGRCGQALPQPPRRVSGMVIGKETFLTPGDVEQMRWVPELVFINCCHLGKTGGGRDLDRGALAANLGMQFIRMGVRAVVAAGWAVDDEAALVFAETFYGRLLSGEPFGEAVRAAREETWLRFPAVNTWGAYQCYGDPDYRVRRDGAARSNQAGALHAPSELVAALDNLASALRTGGGGPGAEADAAGKIDRLVGSVPEAVREAWLARADVSAALGFAWGEARRWTAAI
ncbi:MAG TPA: CHAT domain-containing protein, partial [Rhodocyclaceae bacterium]|nr:CHAT domain-containing protein [Rhodocyclaceae bacterium]